MYLLKAACLAACCLAVPTLWAENPIAATLPRPELDNDSWVLVEIWPEVENITLSAYFLDFSYERNKNLCEATKRALDRDQGTQRKTTKKALSSYRLCMSVTDATAQRYIK
jgi:hypothetical protein